MLSALFLTCLLARAASALPVEPQDRIPLDLRRTTLVVQDLDASLGFHRDALGMTVVYDHVVRTPRSATSDEQAERSMHLVLLRANDDFVGMLGLLQYLKPLRDGRPNKTMDGVLHPRDVVLLFNTKDLERTFARASNTPGITLVERPTPVEYPSYDGQGVIHVMFSSMYDPDGNFVELNQLLDDSLR